MSHISWVTMAMTAVSMKRLNSLYRPASAADIHHHLLAKEMLVLNGLITMIAVIVKTFYGRGSEKFCVVSRVQLFFVCGEKITSGGFSVLFSAQQTCDSGLHGQL